MEATLTIHDALKILKRDRDIYHKDSSTYWCYDLVIRYAEEHLNYLKQSRK